MIAVTATPSIHHLSLDREAKTTPFAIHQIENHSKNATYLSEFVWNTSDTTQLTEPLLNIPNSYKWEHAIKWSGEILQRFNTLSISDALEETTPKEKTELQLLLQKRRQLLQPRSSSEIERDIRNRRAFQKIMEGLSEYVEYL